MSILPPRARRGLTGVLALTASLAVALPATGLAAAQPVPALDPAVVQPLTTQQDPLVLRYGAPASSTSSSAW